MKHDELAALYVANRLAEWGSMRHDGAIKAEMARLRRGVGYTPGEKPELWNLLFDRFPEELMSKTGEPTRAEWAVSTALSLYALHQQGRDLRAESMHVKGMSLGSSVRQIAENEDQLPAVRRRFAAFATSSDMRECAYHMRGLVQLMRAKGIPLDYVQLTKDLYWFQNQDDAQKVKLRWGQDFYREKVNQNEEDIKNEQ